MKTTTSNRNVWALGDYATLAASVIPHLGRHLIDACDIRSGHAVLDVAAGPGNAALVAAERGAAVTALDLTPELLDAGRAAATERGLSLAWRQGDARSLPFGDAQFDAVVSCVGVMFAPDHRTCAHEMLRVCKPGGTLAHIGWTPDGFVGQMLRTMRPFVAAPADPAESPLRWGVADYVAELFGDRVENARATIEAVDVACFDTPTDFVDQFRQYYGPTCAVFNSLAGTARFDQLHAALVELAASAWNNGHMQWEYLLWTAQRCGE